MCEQCQTKDTAQESLEAAAKQVREMAAADGRVVAKKYTEDGEVFIKRVNGIDVELPLIVEELNPSTPELAKRSIDTMHLIYVSATQIKQIKNRKVPLTRKELLGFGVEKSDLIKLAKLGLITEKVIPLLKANGGGKAAMQRAIIYFTPQGRAYIRKHFDDKYGRTQDAEPSNTQLNGNNSQP